MSAIAALYNVPSTKNDLSIWSFCHAAHHADINRLIFQLYGTTLASYVLDPLDINNTGPWLYQHQLMHQAQDEILGIDGFDLLDADFKDPNEFAGWIFINADEHKQAADILEIG
jgi:hypothetical protein